MQSYSDSKASASPPKAHYGQRSMPNSQENIPITYSTSKPVQHGGFNKSFGDLGANGMAMNHLNVPGVSGLAFLPYGVNSLPMGPGNYQYPQSSASQGINAQQQQFYPIQNSAANYGAWAPYGSTGQSLPGYSNALYAPYPQVHGHSGSNPAVPQFGLPASQYHPQATYGYAPYIQVMPAAGPPTDTTPPNVKASMLNNNPGLSRRDSWSSSGSENAPLTPYAAQGWGYNNYNADHPIQAMEHSPPMGVQLPHGTEYQHHGLPQVHFQPSAMLLPNIGGKVARYGEVIPEQAAIEGLANSYPAIPTAVPAIFTSMKKTLQECFANPTHGTNVYIRGLAPDTTDEMLQAYATRFGRVNSHKSIIDNATGQCKGFGFARFETEEEARHCIAGFYIRQYEVGFARVSKYLLYVVPGTDIQKESFNARLKDLSDPDSTNLYVSNLPKEVNEAVSIPTFD
jgi:RNA recognition motif. (a.k.a. RRM, RBD, or RNP domain)